jgi:hypothetical protein
MNMSARRNLSFDSLDRVMPDVDRLLEGHKTVGNWTLGQICNHLAGAVRFSVEGMPFRFPWIMRVAVAPMVKGSLFRTGKMREGIKLPARALPKPGLDDRAETEALRATLNYYAGVTEPLTDHPLFGTLTRDEWDRFHCIHCAHHLSFVLPAGAVANE